ncbi:hypothetical protein [Actinomyces sp. 2119]|uniref:hypothetical protein n=1 Tax=Actinomyces sp. 2119 TaxID=2321393 RepID=UPI0015FFC7D9|nr:hypothetical protein [Actinomyces sp. 2119]
MALPRRVLLMGAGGVDHLLHIFRLPGVAAAGAVGGLVAGEDLLGVDVGGEGLVAAVVPGQGDS